MLYNSICIKMSRTGKPQRQKADCELPGAKGEQAVTASGDVASFGGNENDLKLTVVMISQG